MKKHFYSILAVLLIISGAVTAQNFEGVVEFKKITQTDTMYYTYYVKGDLVKLDEIGKKSKKVEGSFIVNTKEQSTKVLSHNRKLWSEQTKSAPNNPSGKCESTKTKTTKTINGYKCTEYIVKNTEESTIVKYYAAESGFGFFLPLVNTLNRRDKFSLYFKKIPESDKIFPLLSIMTNMDGTEKERMEIIKIEKKAIDDKIFEIPTDYKKFEK